MKRTAIVCLTLTCAVLTGGSAMLAGQVKDDPSQHIPGQMSQARVFVLNHGVKEAIPVTIEGAGEPMKVQVTGTATVQVTGNPAVQVTGSPSVQSHAARQAWEYRPLSIASGQDPVGALNAAGADGWEVTGATLPAQGATLVILKRPR